MTPLTPDDIERLITLCHHERADVRGRALDVLRGERDYWLAQTFAEWCEWSDFVWACDVGVRIALMVNEGDRAHVVSGD